jgi:hypothetical protein
MPIINTRPLIILIGDSVIDNAFWNNVKKNNTGKLLTDMGKLNNFIVDDRSTEELTSRRLLKAIKNKNTIDVGMHYVNARKEIGYPYQNKGKVQVYTESLKLGPSSTIFLSIGGNDVALERNLDIDNIISNIKSIIDIYENTGAKVVYVIPYPATKKFTEQFKNVVDINKLYEDMKSKIKSLGISYISLEDFTDEDRKDPGSGIPEPTIKGAKKIAELIKNKFLDINKILGQTEDGSVQDYKILLQICKNPTLIRNINEVSKNALKWLLPFSKYAVQEGYSVNLNTKIITYYNRVYGS